MLKLQLVTGGRHSSGRRRLFMDLFQSLSVLFAFGVFIITLLTYIEKRK